MQEFKKNLSTEKANDCKWSADAIKQYDAKYLPESDLDELENGLTGNFGVIDTYRYRGFDDVYGYTDFLRITFDDLTEVFIMGISEQFSRTEDNR